MTEIYKIDNLDKNILNALIDNARIPYTELAKKFGISSATIHVRVEKLKLAGIIDKTCIQVNEKKMGFDVCCFIGINLKSAKDYLITLKKLEDIEEITEAYYTTGQYNIFIKMMTKSIDDLQNILIKKVQSIDEIQATETLISLQNPIKRSITI